MLSCVDFGNNCTNVDVSEDFGTILFAGPYAPTHHQGGSPQFIEYYENFTVTVPATFAPGQAALNVAHFNLIGVSVPVF